MYVLILPGPDATSSSSLVVVVIYVVDVVVVDFPASKKTVFVDSKNPH